MSNRLVEFLLNPASYPHQPASVELKETHISWVFLAGQRVYKLKKPVKFDFLDFSSCARREQACRDEVRLNRRLAESIYVGVVPLTEQGGKLELGGQGPIVDWLVEMHRLPAGRTLDDLYQAGQLLPAHIEQLGELLAAFYRRLEPAPLSADEYVQRVEAHVQENRRELLAQAHHLAKPLVQRVHQAQLLLLATHADQFRERVERGCVVEGHGDLRPEHICFAEPPVIFDCIEFSAEFRTLDRLDELAFLASECDQLGAGWVGAQLIESYERLLGTKAPLKLFGFYKAYRACVRAKVEALRAEQLTGESRATKLRQATRYLEFATQYVAGLQPAVCLIVGGLSGTGKSTLARALAEKLGLELLRSDVIRQELFTAEQRAHPERHDVYSEQGKSRVYAELHRRGAELLSQGVSVVLDATYERAELVSKVESIAAQAKGVFLAMECVCPAEVAVERIGRRQAEGRDASQADEAVYRQQHRAREAWPAAVSRAEIDTRNPIAEQVDQVIARLAQIGGDRGAG